MATRIGVYSAKQVAVIVAGISIDDGRGDPFVKISGAAEQFTVEQGVDGESVVRSHTHNRIYSVEITLKGHSKHNAMFSALLAADDEASNGAGIVPLMIKDNNGSTLVITDKAWIRGTPETSKGAGPVDITWTFDLVASPKTVIIGGN